MEETKEKILTDKMSGLTDEDCDVINEGLETVADSDIDEAIQTFENDSDVQRLKAQEAELTRMMSVISDPKIMKAYRAIRKDVYGVGERHQVSQKEKKKKKAKRRMAKKSKR
jgi:hypothetical protein